jgi:predicted nucleic acid-binding protein
MALRVSVDTTFLIDLQKERLREQDDGPAHGFLQAAPDTELYLSVVALGEFGEGFASVEHPIVRAVRDRHTLLALDEETALIYAAVARELRHRGRLIGGNDLWIGATSLRYGLPVLTADVEHFRRIEGLDVLEYS